MTTASFGEIIVDARAGDENALDQLRLRLGPDPSRANPHIFDVTPNTVLHDSLVLGPQSRKDVFAPIPAFVPEVIRVFGKTWAPRGTSAAIAAIAACPPLEKFFMGKALAHMEEMETRLITQESLSRADRARLRRQLTVLGAQGGTFWENWIWHTPPIAHVQFDRLVHEWLSGPVDMNEAAWFEPSRRNRLYSAESADRFFGKLPLEIRIFLNIGRLEFNEPPYPVTDCAFLQSTLEEANRLAKLLKVNFRFDPG
jgi:hypothetical protein